MDETFFESEDEYVSKYMSRAIELARMGIGKVNPNPLVGALVVKNGSVLGEGYHERYGKLHAERHALKNLREPAQGADMFVTMEPCCHQGKQPPCTDAIIENGIARVYVGSDDPNPLVAGKGIQALRDAGIEVITHVMKKECDRLNKVFFHYITKHTPYVVMKYAMSMDGKIACDNGQSRWLTGEESRSHVQEARNRYAGIMVGIQTVLADDPMLTCKLENGRDPIRIVCDSKLRIPLDSKLVQTAKEVPVIVATISDDWEKTKALMSAGVQVLVTHQAEGRVDLVELMKKLGEKSIDGILLEGGATLNASALKSGIVNHLQVYLAPKLLGGSGRYTPIAGAGVDSLKNAYRLTDRYMSMYGDDIFLEYDLEK